MISFIVPIRNEAHFISKTIKSLLNQKTKIDFEILIVDGLSIDGTREIIKDFQNNYSNIFLIDNPKKIVPVGFNKAISIAKGEIIIRVDGHATIKTNYIEQCLIAFEKTGADCVGGAIRNYSKGIFGNSINIAQSSYFGTGGAAFRKKIDKGKYVGTLAFGAYKRYVFNEIGGYDEELIRNQDDEFNMRLIQNKGTIWMDPNIQSTYYPRSTLMKFFMQYLQYGFFKIRVMQKRRGFASFRHIVPLLFVSALSISFSLFLIFNISFPLKLILVSYMICLLVGTLNAFISNTQNLLSIIILPLSFFSMHFAYGLGSFFGMIYFFNKWKDRQTKDFHFNKEQFINNNNF